MPAVECLCQSIGTPETYTLKNGRMVEVRQGYAYDSRTREELASPDEAGDYILKTGRLQEWERELISYWKRDAWKQTGRTPTAVRQASSDSSYRVFEKRGEE